MIPADAGDVWVVRTESRFGWWIRLGAALANKPNLGNHVLIVHHADSSGTVWGIEGRPGGVGWVDTGRYRGSKYLMANASQPKTDSQRALVCQVMASMLKVGYDWEAIAQDALKDLGLAQLWSEKWHGETPGHVVCSSVAAWAYSKAVLDYPQTDDMRHVQPADWCDFILTKKYG